jgi:predicted XRE-type DNA-binding protein
MQPHLSYFIGQRARPLKGNTLTLNNAFELITDDPKAVENYTMRSNMMNAIVDLIKIKEWTQQQAAENLGVSQPRISNLKNGKISRFSVDMLMRMLGKLGFTFEFNYTRNKQPDLDISIIICNKSPL